MTPATDTEPLADQCSLCGDGYHTTLKIEISDEPVRGEYRWAHEKCLTDHGTLFRALFRASSGE